MMKVQPSMLTREIQLAEVLEAIADPVRLDMLRVLKEGHEKCKDIEGYQGIHVSDIAKEMHLPQPTVSKHLAKLRSVGLVKVVRQAQWMYYRRDEEVIARVKEQITSL
jgi:ArsR family transcriptional regulator